MSHHNFLSRINFLMASFVIYLYTATNQLIQLIWTTNQLTGLCIKRTLLWQRLIHFSPVLLLIRNQSIDLHNKSMDRFLSNGNTRLKWFRWIWANYVITPPLKSPESLTITLIKKKSFEDVILVAKSTI